MPSLRLVLRHLAGRHLPRERSGSARIAGRSIVLAARRLARSAARYTLCDDVDRGPSRAQGLWRNPAAAGGRCCLLAVRSPPPPAQIVIAAGPEGGACIEAARRQAGHLARDNIRLDLLETAGPIENLDRVSAGQPRARIAIAFEWGASWSAGGGEAARPRGGAIPVWAEGSARRAPALAVIERGLEGSRGAAARGC